MKEEVTFAPNKYFGFEIVSNERRKFPSVDVNLPKRGTAESAGYDFYSNETVIILPGSKHLFWTDIKSYMTTNFNLDVYVRSSIAVKKDLVLCNQVGIIDKDYYGNESNDGNIGICLRNLSSKSQIIEIGERIAQGIFRPYANADTGNSTETRTGGIGHTNNK